jgi:fatty-acyl-CoA synthase
LEDLPATPTPVDLSFDVAEKVKSIITAQLGCSSESYERQTDLRYLGLDSLGGVELMEALEQAFGISFEDEGFIEPVYFNRAALVEAVKRSAARKMIGPSPQMAADWDWAQSTISAVLLRRLQNPRQEWNFKLVRSAEPFDAELISARELLRKASGWARIWDAAGIPCGAPIAIALPPCAALLAAIVGTLLSDRQPLVLPEPNQITSDVAEWRERSTRIAGRIPPLCCEPWVAERLGGRRATAFAPPAEHSPETRFHLEQQAQEVALLIRSSGTSGANKIAAHTHRGVLSRIQELEQAQKLTHEDRLVSWVPLHHTIGLVNGFLLPLVLDLQATLLPPSLFAQRPDVLMRELSATHSTFSYMPNFAFAHCARNITDQRLVGLDLSHIRSLTCAGEPVTAAALDRFFERLAPVGLRRSALSSGYGMAEAAGAITQSPLGREPLRVSAAVNEFQQNGRIEETTDANGAALVFVSSGRVLPAVRVRIRGEGAESLPEGYVGTIEVASPSLVQSFLDPERADSAAPPLTTDGFLRTGDLGFMLQGELFVTGRSNDMIIAAGKNVSPAAVEETLSSVAGVAAYRILVFGADRDGTQQLEVVIELPSTPSEEEADTLKQKIRGKVLDFYQVPVGAVHLFSEPVLVRTASGKVSRADSRQSFLQHERVHD